MNPIEFDYHLFGSPRHRIKLRSLFCAAWGLILLPACLWFLSTDQSYAQSSFAQTAKTSPHQTMVNTEISPSLEQEDIPSGTHTSRPRISPNGHFAAITVVPMGTETAFLARTYLYETKTNTLRDILPGYTPRWLNNGAILQLETVDRGLRYYAVGNAIRELEFSVGDQQPNAEEPILPELRLSTPLSLTYPTTIRVAHHPSNGCRDLPEWQVDEIPFEEYIARVVPAETPASWPRNALAAQAVAARTYAWRQILVGRSDYDVTDWANFQMMCDDRYANSDTAVAMTAGIYLVALDDPTKRPISAMYSAENGHPTLTNVNVSYLQSVPDPFALGRPQWGHGYGLSQWGAYRRARAGQDYRQILGHYYSNIYLYNGLDPTTPLGALLDMVPGQPLGMDQVRLRAMAPPELTPRFVITASRGLTSAVVIDGNHIIWKPDQPLPESTEVTISLWLADQWQASTKHLVDRTPPVETTLHLPTIITTALTTFILPAGEGTPLLAPALGEAASHHHNWLWEGESLFHTSNSGEAMVDEDASQGIVWRADPVAHTAGVWYGPYTQQLPAGHSYRALFWLRSEMPITINIPITLTSATPIARLDVTDRKGQKRLGLRDLWTSDLVNGNAYTPVAVDFHLFERADGVEFRVAWPGHASLILDRVEVWQLPDALDRSDSGVEIAAFDWNFYGQPLQQTLAARFFDGADNLGTVHTHDVTLVDQEPPRFGAVEGAAAWVTSTHITLSTTVSDTFSGIDLTKGQLVVANETDSFHLPITMTTPPTDAVGFLMQAVVIDLADDTYTATFVAFDRTGNRAEQQHLLRIDRQPPQVTIRTTEEATAGWYLKPMTVTVQASDQGSGVASTEYMYDMDQPTQRGVKIGATEIHTKPLQLNMGGIYTITAWATDSAGNRSHNITETLRLDLAAPTVQLHQTVLNATTIRIGWKADDDGAGVTAVEIALQRDEGDWETMPWAEYMPKAEIDLTIDPEERLRVRARAQDQVGRVGEWTVMELWVATDQLFLPMISR